MIYEEAARDYSQWIEYVDTDGYMSEDEFNSTPVDKKVQIIIDCFGPEEPEEEEN